MTTLKVNLDEELLKLLIKFSEKSKKTEEEMLKEIIEKSIQEEILNKAHKIINEESSLLKKLA